MRLSFPEHGVQYKLFLLLIMLHFGLRKTRLFLTFLAKESEI